jgi:hypothetical protein
MGRPTDFTQEIADKICLDISEGKSLRAICEDDDLPSRVTVYNWLKANESFLNQYTRAREEQADYYVEQMIEIAETEKDVARARLRVDTLKWVASKFKGTLYGDKQTIDHQTKGEKVKPVAFLSDEELAKIVADREE